MHFYAFFNHFTVRSLKSLFELLHSLLLISLKTIMNHPVLTNVKDLQNFLGVMNFYWRFMPGVAQLHRLLTEALNGSPRPNTTMAYHLQSNGMVERAHSRLMDTLKARMAPAPSLGPPGHQQYPKEDRGKSTVEMVYDTTFILPAQPVASQKQPVEEILRNLHRCAPAPGSGRGPLSLQQPWQQPNWSNCGKATNCNPWCRPNKSHFKVLEKGPKSSSSAWTSAAKTQWTV